MADVGDDTQSTGRKARTYTRDADGQFVCDRCDKRTPHQNTMHYHMRRHNEDFCATCTTCGKGFLQRASLEAHVQATGHGAGAAGAAGPVDFACTHAECGHRTRTKANLLVHIARAHCSEWLPAYKEGGACRGCGRGHASAAAYLYHAAKCLLPSTVNALRAQEGRAGTALTALTPSLILSVACLQRAWGGPALTKAPAPV